MAKLSAEKQERIKGLLLEGKSPPQIAQTVGCSIATAERYHRYWLPEIRDSVNRNVTEILKASIKAAKQKR